MKLESQILKYDCVDFMRERMIPEGSVDLAIVDPPYNIGYDYDVYDDRKSLEEYIDWCNRWLLGLYTMLKPGGAMWLIIGDEYAAELKVAAHRNIDFNLRSWIVWYYTFGVNCKAKFTRSHAHLLYFLKGKKANTFNVEELKVPSSRQLVYNDKRAASGGRLPDDTWILHPRYLPGAFSSGEDTWNMSRICGTFKERAGTPNQLPEQLIGRIVRACSNPGDVVFDPMCGSGTVPVVAKRLGRIGIGLDISDDYIAAAQARLQDATVGSELVGPIPPGDLQLGETT